MNKPNLPAAPEIPAATEAELDPIFVSSLREAKWIVVAWTLNFAWVIGYSLSFGYRGGDEPSELITRLGMPAWVFWGVFTPWIVTTLFTAWFALTQMDDHPLDDEPRGESVDG